MKKLIPCGDNFTLTVTKTALKKAGIDINLPFDIIFQQPHALTKKRAPVKKTPIKKTSTKKATKKNRVSTDADIKAVIKRDFNALKKLADL